MHAYRRSTMSCMIVSLDKKTHLHLFYRFRRTIFSIHLLCSDSNFNVLMSLAQCLSLRCNGNRNARWRHRTCNESDIRVHMQRLRSLFSVRRLPPAVQLLLVLSPNMRRMRSELWTVPLYILSHLLNHRVSWIFYLIYICYTACLKVVKSFLLYDPSFWKIRLLSLARVLLSCWVCMIPTTDPAQDNGPSPSPWQCQRWL